MESHERRNSSRIASQGERIAIQLIDELLPSPAAPSPRAGLTTAEIIDISTGGIGLRTTIPLEMGQKILLVADGRERQGIVAWVSQNGKEYRAGIQFI